MFLDTTIARICILAALQNAAKDGGRTLARTDCTPLPLWSVVSDSTNATAAALSPAGHGHILSSTLFGFCMSGARTTPSISRGVSTIWYL
jgi:hypothetical protein